MISPSNFITLRCGLTQQKYSNLHFLYEGFKVHTPLLLIRTEVFTKMATPAAPAFEKRILVTGGAGFIGSHVVVHLVRCYPQYYVVNLDSLDYCSCLRNVHESISTAGSSQLPANYKFIKGSLTGPDLVEYVLQTEQIDTVLHFASQSHVDNSFGNSIAFSQTNMLGTHVLLEATKVNGGIKKFIHVSTDEVYGEGRFDSKAMTEDHVLEPTNPYAATKAGAEFLVKAYNRSFKLPIVIVRPNNVYGPHQYPEKLIPKFINQIARDRPLTIHGDGQNTRTYVHVDDVVQAFDVVLHKGEIGEVYNIGGTSERSTKQVARDLLAIMRPNAADRGDRMAFVADRPFNDLRYTIDSSKLRSLGWQEYVTWLEGLQRTVDWYAQNGERFFNIDQALEPHPINVKKLSIDGLS